MNWLEYYLKRKLTKSEWVDLLKIINANHPELEDKKEKKRTKIDVNKTTNTIDLELKAPEFTR